VKQKLNLPTIVGEDLAEEIGLHTGDGSMNFYNGRGLFQLRGHIFDDAEHYYKRITELYMKLYGISLNIRKMESTGVIGFQIWNDDLVDFKHKIGLPLGKKNELNIPTILNNRLLFFSFMRGLFDTDGCLFLEKRNKKLYPRIEIRTVSQKLCSQMVSNFSKYGFPCKSFKHVRKEKKWNDIYIIRFNGIPNLRKWWILIGSNNPKHLKKFTKFIGEKT
jgi:hypothetical protein